MLCTMCESSEKELKGKLESTTVIFICTKHSSPFSVCKQTVMFVTQRTQAIQKHFH